MIELLPKDIIHLVFDSLDTRDLYNLYKVNCNIQQLISDYVRKSDVKYILDLCIEIERLKRSIDTLYAVIYKRDTYNHRGYFY